MNIDIDMYNQPKGGHVITIHKLTIKAIMLEVKVTKIKQSEM